MAQMRRAEVQRSGIWHPFSEGSSNGQLDGPPSSVSCLVLSFPPPSSSSGVNCIEHQVTKMDTLAGIAIKYGVEIADIKRMNNLVSDLQMFAHKSLQIPLPGRHIPPPPVNSNASPGIMNREQTPIYQPNNDVADSANSLKFKSPQRSSSAMSTLQSYYGFAPRKGDPAREGTEMAVYANSNFWHLSSAAFPKVSPAPDAQNGDFSEERKKSKGDMSVRRRQKANADILLDITKLSEYVGGASGKIGRGLFPRPRSGIQLDTDVDRRDSTLNGDPIAVNRLPAVRRSCSTSILAESESSSSVWSSSKWALNPKPVSAWRSKAALD